MAVKFGKDKGIGKASLSPGIETNRALKYIKALFCSSVKFYRFNFIF